MLAQTLLSIAVLLATGALPGSSASTLASGRLDAAYSRRAVVIVLDGARPGYFNLVPMPHLRALMRRGTTYTRAFVGQELANTPPSHATIGTGMFPKHHGVQGFLWENPRTHGVENVTDRNGVMSGDLERVMVDQNSPSLAHALKASEPQSRIVSVAAHKCYAADAMGTSSADYILCSLIYHDRWVAQAVPGHQPPPGAINNPKWDVPIPPPHSGFGAAVQQWRVGGENDWTMRYALWVFHRVHPRLLMINLAETDILGHFDRNDGVIKVLMRRFDSLLGKLENAYRQAGLLNNTDFVITADHGMSRIKKFVPYSVLSQALAWSSATPVYIEHDTGAAMGIREEEKARLVGVNLFRLGRNAVDATYFKVFNHGKWSYQPSAIRRGLSPAVQRAYLALANTMAAASGPDVWAVLEPHASLRATSVNGYHWLAGHLGPQWADQHIPLVLAGPGIKSGQISTYPARLVDIAPTLEQLLGAGPNKSDGIPLENALRRPVPADLARQRTRARYLKPIVAALRARSGL